MKNFILATLVFSITLSGWSQSGTGPYKKSSKANLAQKIVHLLDNSTVGAVQTVLGASHILVFGILNPIMGEDFGISTHNNKKSEVSQIIVETDAINAGAYSLGLFQVGDYAHKHEGGHSVASAALGPLYLPMVGLSYALEGHHGSFFETWADMEADPEGFMNTSSAQIGLGSTMFKGQQTNVVVFKFNLEQRQVQEYSEVASDKILQWVNTNIVAPMIQNQGHDEMPVLVEFDLLKKRLNLVVDNIDLYLGGDQKLRNSIQTEQRYLHIENNPVLKQVHIKALDWSFKYGLQYNLGEELTITPRVGFGASAGAMSETGTDYKNFMFQDKYNFAASFKFNAGIDVRVWNYATLTGEYEKEHFTNGMSKSTWSAKLHNEFRDPFKKIGFIQYVDVGASFKSERWDTPTGTQTWNQWNATLGLRF